MIGKILKNMRLSAKLTQDKLGRKLFLSDTTISSYERENSHPNFETIIKICKICGYELVFKDKNDNVITIEEMAKEKDF